MITLAQGSARPCNVDCSGNEMGAHGISGGLLPSPKPAKLVRDSFRLPKIPGSAKGLPNFHQYLTGLDLAEVFSVQGHSLVLSQTSCGRPSSVSVVSLGLETRQHQSDSIRDALDLLRDEFLH